MSLEEYEQETQDDRWATNWKYLLPDEQERIKDLPSGAITAELLMRQLSESDAMPFWHADVPF